MKKGVWILNFGMLVPDLLCPCLISALELCTSLRGTVNRSTSIVRCCCFTFNINWKNFDDIVGCCVYKQGSRGANTQLSELASSANMSATWCHNARELLWWILMYNMGGGIDGLWWLIASIISGRCGNRWSICTNDIAAIECGKHEYFLFLEFHAMQWDATELCVFSLHRRSKKIIIFHSIWVFPASSQWTISAKPWRRVIQVLMVDFLYHDVQQRKSFRPWFATYLFSSFLLIFVQ